MTDPTKQEGAKQVTAPFQITGQPTNAERYLKMLIYGGYGCGKTTLAGTAVDVESMGDVLFVDAESGQMTLDDNPRIDNPDKIQRIRVKDFKTVAAIQDYLLKHCVARDADDTERLKRQQSMLTNVPVEEIVEPWKFRTVIIDSITEVNEYCMYQLLKLSTDMDLDVDKMAVAEWPEFRKNNQMMQLVIRAYRDLPMNVILVSSSQYTQDEMKRKHFAPNITGKLAGQIQGFMDVVGYMKAGKDAEGEDIRRLFIQPTGNFDAKNRRAISKAEYLDNPKMGDVLSTLGLN